MWIWIVLIVLAVLCAAVFVIFAPARPNQKKKAPFYGKNFAHRGLYQKDQSIPENSLPAFAKAVEAGYGMELDVQLSRDGKVVVFHDDTLDRVCGVSKRVDELDYAELLELRLCGTEEKIPLFDEVLATVGGKTPMIVELKTGRRNEELCEKTLFALRGYAGEYCVESFDPTIVAWFRKHAPEIYRGQLAQPPKHYRKHGKSRLVSFFLGTTAMNVIARPNFIAYRIGKKTLGVRFAELLGATRVAWTSHDEATEKKFDVVIFEHYLPQTQYKHLK